MNGKLAVTTGPTVHLTGRWLHIARQAVLVAQIARRLDGLRDCLDYAALITTLTSASSRQRQSDTADLQQSEFMTA